MVYNDTNPVMLRRYQTYIKIYGAVFFLSLHYFITVYINSSFLGRFTSPQGVSLLYIAGSVLAIAGFVLLAPVLRRTGNVGLFIGLSIVEAGVLGALAFATHPVIILTAFIFHQALPVILLFCLDIFLEQTLPNEKNTGLARGLFLTSSNIALVLAPLLFALLIVGDNFSFVYGTAALCLMPAIAIAFLTRKKFKDPHYHLFKPLAAAHALWHNRDLRAAWLANFLLQFFYAWMVVYMPIYLNQKIGMSWESMGVVFTIMLLPFLLVELPVGRLADRLFGEQEMMAAGFFIAAITTALIPLVYVGSVAVWAVLLFATRIGAALVEITTESYFFKKVSAGDNDIISAFRSTRPLSYIAGPAVGGLLLLIFPFNALFIVLAALMLSGMGLAGVITDSR